MNNPFDGCEIWFLTGSQDLYGEDTLAQVAEQSQEVARTVHVSRQLGEPLPIAQQHVDSLYDRYQNVYGQPSAPDSDPTAGQQTQEA